MFKKNPEANLVHRDNNTVKSREVSSEETKNLRVYTVDKNNPKTPYIENGAVVTLGTSPEDGSYNSNVDGLVRVNFPGLEGQMSRQAVQLGLVDGSPRIRSVTENNKVTIWSTDQASPRCAKSRKGKPLGDEVWSRLGNHINADIETSDGTLVRVRIAGGGGSEVKEDVLFLMSFPHESSIFFLKPLYCHPLVLSTHYRPHRTPHLPLEG